MEKFFIWYTLQLKVWIKRKSCWLQIFGMIFFVLIISNINIPSSDNISVGICNIQEGYSQKIYELIQNSESNFRYIIYDNEDNMESDILSGRIECGFVFKDDFDESLQNKDIKKIIKYISTPFTTKGAVAREVFFSHFFDVYGNIVAVGCQESFFGITDEGITESITSISEELKDSGQIFDVNFKTVSSGVNIGEKNYKSTKTVKSCTALMIFVIMFTAVGRKFEKSGKGIRLALDIRQRRIFDYLDYIAAATPAAAVGLAVILMFEENTFVLTEFLFMLIYVLLCGLWILIVGSLFKNSTTFAAWIMTLVVINILVCPVLFDASDFIPAINYVNWLFPLGIYLRL